MVTLNENKVRMGAVEIIQAIFNAFTIEQAPCSAKRLEDITGLPSSTLYKFISSLVNIGFVSKHHNKTYFVGAKIAIYGDLYHAEYPYLVILKNMIKNLAECTGCTTQLCTYTLNKYMVISEYVPDTEYSLRSEVLGRRQPITWTATGRLLIPYETREDLFRGLPKEDLKMPDNSPINLDSLAEEIVQAKKDNFFQYKSPLNTICTCMATAVQISDNEKYTMCVSLPNRADQEMFINAKKHLMSTTAQANQVLQKIGIIFSLSNLP